MRANFSARLILSSMASSGDIDQSHHIFIVPLAGYSAFRQYFNLGEIITRQIDIHRADIVDDSGGTGEYDFSSRRVPEMSLLVGALSSRIRPCLRICPFYGSAAAFGCRVSAIATCHQACFTRSGALNAPTDATSALSGALFVAIYSLCPFARWGWIPGRVPGLAYRTDSWTRLEPVNRFGQHCSVHDSANSPRHLPAAVCALALS